MQIIVLSGQEADSKLKEERFIADWERLLAGCPWATACQSPAFVLTWYATFRPHYRPVLAVAYAANHSLCGLLTLACKRGEKQLIAAGGIEAEYQCWLERPDLQGAFMRLALPKLHEWLPHMQLQLRYLLPGTPLEWLDKDADLRQHCLLQSRRRPLLQVDREAAARRLSSKNNKRIFNKLKRAGEITFQRITNPAEFASHLDDVIRYYDLRQGALYTLCPFRDQPLKKPFLLALFRTGLLHATVLRVGEAAAAFHLGVISNACVHLGIIAHSPFFAHAAPGRLHLLMLAHLLAEEQVATFDLTPGSGYKDLLATGHDEVYTLTFYPHRTRRIKAGLYQTGRQALKGLLLRHGRTPHEARQALEKRKSQLRRLLATLLPPVRAHKLLAYHCLAGQLPLAAGTAPVARDALDDVLDILPPGSARQTFLANAMQRLEEKQHVYTRRSTHGDLSYCWAIEPASEAVLPGMDSAIPFPATASVLFDCRPAARDTSHPVLCDWLLALSQDACRRDRSSEIYFLVAAQDNLLQRALEAIGYRRQGFLLDRRVLGHRRLTLQLPMADRPPMPPA